MSRLRSIAFLLVLALAVPARADGTADEADFRFRRAAEFYAKGRFDDALAEFFVSNRLVRNRNVMFNIARCFEQLGQWNEAYRAYVDLVSEPWSADERQALDQAIERMRPRLALVTVRTTPPGAEVFIDRRDLGSRGVSPKTLALPPGAATVLVALPGHKPASLAVTLEKGREVDVSIALEKILGRLLVVTTPAGAEVVVAGGNERATCVSPCDLRVPPGRHALSARLAGHVDARSDVDVVADTEASAALALVPLPPPTGKLVVTANKDGALVRIDSVESGFTPMVLDSVRVGAHEVTVSLEGYETYRASVEVSAEHATNVNARLLVPAPAIASASKALTSSREAPASVTVITADEIRAFGYRTLFDAMRAVRGLYVTTDGIYDIVGVRGFSPEGDVNGRMLVLVDGHTANDLWTGQAPIGLDLDVDLTEVERIEVVRGPASALYGSSAVFGVVNVVKRAALPDGNLQFTATAGNQGTARGRVSAGFRGENASGVVTVAGTDATGPLSQLIEPNLGADAALPAAAQPVTVRGNAGERATHVGARLRVGAFSLLADLNARPRSTPLGIWGSTIGKPTRAADTRGFAEGRWAGAMGPLQASVRAYYDEVHYEAENAYEPPTQESDGARWLGSELRVNSGGLFREHLVGLGLEYQRIWSVFQNIWEPSTSTTLLKTEHSGHVVNGFVTEDWRIADRISLQAALGLRLGSTGAVGAAPEAWTAVPNPRLALVARPYEGGVTKAMMGRAFRAPSIYERYYAMADSQLPAAGSLEPELIYSAELEHAHQVNEALLVTLAVHGSRLEKLISLDAAPGAADPAIVQFQNTPVPRWVLGAEGEVRWQPSRLTLVTFSYSFQHSRNPAAGSDTPQLNSPAHLAVLRGMHAITPGLSVGAEAIYGSARLARDGSSPGEALLVNATLSGDAPAVRARWSLSAFNLLDEQYAVPSSYGSERATVPQQGRMVQATISKAF